MFTPAIRAMESPLSLLVPRVGADDPHYAIAADDLAVAAELLDRSQYFHHSTLAPRPSSLLRPERDPRARQVVRRELDGDLVAGEDLDVVHAHLSRDMSEHHVAVLELHAGGRVGQHFGHLALHRNRLFLRHQRVGTPPLT